MAEHRRQKWDGQSRGGSFGTWCFVMLIRHCGLGAAYALLALVVPYFVIFAPKATRAAWRFSRRVRGLGPWSAAREVVATYYAFGQCIIDKIAIGQGREDLFRFELDGKDQIAKLFAGGDRGECRAAIFVGGHVGAWEAGSPLFARFGKKMNVTIFDNEHEDIKKLLEREQRGRTFSLIPLGRDWLASVMEVKNALDRGEFVCFMGDRYMTGSPTREMDFLGHKARFTNGPFDVAAAMRVPMAFFFAMREAGRKYHVYFTVLDQDPGARPKSEALQKAFVKRLEEIVRQYPRQWFNFFDYFDN